MKLEMEELKNEVSNVDQQVRKLVRRNSDLKRTEMLFGNFEKNYCFSYDWVLFRVLRLFLSQLKAMDDAITKAEEQVEKFTEMAKETKVLLYDLKNIYFVLSLVPLLVYCS